MTKKEYNAIPVYCCKNCGGLGIIKDPVADYCNECGQTILIKCSIQAWEVWNKRNHGRKTINK